jgi:tetratricopeptide (TPR) repeat protein
MKSALFLSFLLALTSITTTPTAVSGAAQQPVANLRNLVRSASLTLYTQQQFLGSGVIVHRQGDLYTLVTSRHVVCGGSRCRTLPAGKTYRIKLFDDREYTLQPQDIKLLSDDLDLAIVQFRSSRTYGIAKVAAPGSLNIDDTVYTSGFPSTQSGFSFNAGQAIAVVNRRLTTDLGGYSIIYDAETFAGMSGGGVFNRRGELVAIHGVGDRYKATSDLTDPTKIDTKIGYNRGIPIRWMVQNLSDLGIRLGGDQAPPIGQVAQIEIPRTADEHFIAGFNRSVDPGDNATASNRLAIQEFSTAIQLNPRYAKAYAMRGYVYLALGDFDRAIQDYSQVIHLDPRNTKAFYNRGYIRAEKLKDSLGGIADYSKVLQLNPRDTDAYNNRGILQENLGNLQGALADYSQAITVQTTNGHAYYNRALLKKNKLGDRSGAIQDFQRAIQFYRNQGQTQDAQDGLARLRELGVDP